MCSGSVSTARVCLFHGAPPVHGTVFYAQCTNMIFTTSAETWHCTLQAPLCCSVEPPPPKKKNIVTFTAFSCISVKMEIEGPVIRPWESVISCPLWREDAEMIIWVRFNFKETVKYKQHWRVLALQTELTQAEPRYGFKLLSSVVFVLSKTLQPSWE